ncbi:MAG TPA: NTP transferase domain-containing protein [Acidimicrobiales bacterium]|jgi:CTP:molybdopterin cytidylyltransferase MocA
MGPAEGQRALIVLAAGRARRYGGCKPLAPVGPGGEAVIDLVASDALAAGFDSIVLVIGPHTGPAIRYHVERTWPSAVDVRFEVQDRPLGTVDAVLAGTRGIPADRAIGVANADDLYGPEAMVALASHLATGRTAESLVGFRLRNAVLGDGPVTRGVCEVDEQGYLVAIAERRGVHATGDGRYLADDGREPTELDGDALVSMNLWGFGPAMREVLRHAMAAAGDVGEEAEVLLPDVVARQLSGSRTDTVDGPGRLAFEVLPAAGRCIGVTHPDDLAVVQEQLARAVGRGERDAAPWMSVERGGTALP